MVFVEQFTAIDSYTTPYSTTSGPGRFKRAMLMVLIRESCIKKPKKKILRVMEVIQGIEAS